VSLKERLTTLLQDFDEITDRELRGDLLIDYATRFTPVSDTIAKRPYPAAHKVPGCESEVYAWVTRAPDGTVQCHFAVENPPRHLRQSPSRNPARDRQQLAPQ
jgi:sulfur transfer protein SufE